MGMTVAEEWAGAEPVVLPWRGEETGWTLREMVHECPKCGERMSDPRGRIYESLGVVEIHLAERCPSCGEVTECRERLCPKEGVVMRMVNGQWLRFQMVVRQSRAREALRTTLRVAAIRVLPGYGAGVLAGVVFTEPTAATYAVWAGGLVAILLLVYGVEYWMEGRR